MSDEQDLVIELRALEARCAELESRNIALAQEVQKWQGETALQKRDRADLEAERDRLKELLEQAPRGYNSTQVKMHEEGRIEAEAQLSEARALLERVRAFLKPTEEP